MRAYRQLYKQCQIQWLQLCAGLLHSCDVPSIWPGPGHPPPPIVLCALRFSAWSQEGFARCYLQRFSISCVTAISKDHHHLGCVAFREQLDVKCFRPLRKGWEWLTKEARCPTSNIQDLSCEGRFGVTRQEWPGAQSVTCKCGYSRARLSRISKAFPSETAVPKAPRGVVTFLFPISSSCGVVDAVPRR